MFPRGKLGVSYTGEGQTTEKGYHCQKWSHTSPHNHSLARLGDHNYCRNPAGSSDPRVWCYTTDPGKRWDYCSVPECDSKAPTLHLSLPPGCQNAANKGKDYNGEVALTQGGKACRPWTNTKHPELSSNFCRNPDGAPDGVWCYTRHRPVGWDYCNVTLCR